MAFTKLEFINYILNGRADKGAALWKTYQDTAAALPVDGIGGTPTVTFGVSQTTPLSGTTDFNFTKPAANVQGQGVSIPFDIESSDLAKVLTITFDYEVVSGTYADGDLAVYVVQDPSGTPVAIQPAGFRVLNLASGNRGKVIATFQTHASLKNYRLCLHVASTSTAAYVLAVDNVSVGPQVVQYGAPVTDWQSYTPTFTGLGTVTALEMHWRRVGDHVQIKGKFTAGASTAVEARMSLPGGLSSASTDRIPTIQVGGQMYVANATNQFLVLQEPSVSYVTFGFQNGATNPLTKQLGTLFGNGIVYSIITESPILGWSSTVQMSNDTDTRVVAASCSAQTNTVVIPANVETVIPCSVKHVDTHGAYNTSTGKYEIKVPGIYSIVGTINFGDAGGVVVRLMRLYKNATILDYASWDNAVASGTSKYLKVSSITEAVPGDTIDIRMLQAIVANLTLADARFTIQRLSGPSAIAASETVAAVYKTTVNVGQSITSGAFTIVDYANKEIDTHGAVTTGAAWKFTAPIAGTYCVSAKALYNSGASATSSSYLLALYKGGNLVGELGRVNGTGGVNFFGPSGSRDIFLLAGESIDVRTLQDSGGIRSLYPFVEYNHVSIHRIGN